ncbi:MAG: hypothetical protein IPG43_06225 [Proteobacteria bacterium]|nr:hypothetical protein [Pseudomonadota bacterium]
MVDTPPRHSPVMRWLLEQSNFAAVRQADLTVSDQAMPRPVTPCRACA